MGGSDKPKQAKPATATSTFNGVQTSNVALSGFGTGSTSITGDKNNRTINTSYTPDEDFKTILEGAKQGVQNNQSIFNLSPEEQFAQVEQNPYYQEQKLQNQQFLTQGQADARQAASRSGLENSTIAGAIEASLLKDASLMDWQARTGAVDYGRSIAAQNMGIHQGIMDQIYGYTTGPTQMSNQTFMQAGDNQDQIAMANAKYINDVNLANAQMANQMAAQRAQNRSALIGNIISAGATLAAAPFTGGTSLIGAGVKALSSRGNAAKPIEPQFTFNGKI